MLYEVITKTKYSDSKRQAVFRKLKKGISLKLISKEMNIPYGTLISWNKKYRQSVLQRTKSKVKTKKNVQSTLVAESKPRRSAETVELTLRNRALEEENAILRKLVIDQIIEFKAIK